MLKKNIEIPIDAEMRRMTLKVFFCLADRGGRTPLDEIDFLAINSILICFSN
jgi:hypothetical protein